MFKLKQLSKGSKMYSENTYDSKEKLNSKLPHPIVIATNYFLNYDMSGISFNRKIEGAGLLSYLEKIFRRDYSHLSKEQFSNLLEVIIKDFKIEQKKENEIIVYDEIIDFFMSEIKYELLFQS